MEFYFFLGGYWGPNFSIEKVGDVLEYRANDHPMFALIEPVIYQPSASQWREFNQQLDQFKNWKNRYDSEILDGTQWELRLRYGKLRLKCFGSNSFPEDFDQLITAIQNLTGDPKCFKEIEGMS